jgi:hypothetical protein
MKIAKNLLAATTLLLLLVATYMRITESVVTSRYIARRGGPWVTRYESANSIFLCALLTGILWFLIFWMDRQRSRE